MPITTDKNTAYGPPLVNQKYAPLANINFNVADRPIYTGMLNNRATLLRSAGMLGQGLRLATTPSWAAITAAEAGHLAPLVVVSSNRAGWIRRGIDAAATQLGSLGIAAFANASDLRALTDLTHQNISPPLYTPSRIGANRNVYVVVHMSEYPFYKTSLNGTGITPVGWEFQRAGGPRNVSLVGFGAARFAAMEFCKRLRRLAAAAAGAAPWDFAWLIDDNVVALSGFAGFAAVEAAIGPADACAGFHGGTSADPAAATRAWAVQEVNAGRGGAAATLPASAPPGIVQQAALWNVRYFDQNFLNFGPAYISSAEDLSITNYFNTQAIPYLYYNGIGVLKEEPKYDDRGGAQKVNKARRDLAAWVTAAESTDPPMGAPPPPIMVQPFNAADGVAQTLSRFVVDRVLPNAAAMNGQAANAAVQNLAKCQAVEQLTCGGINQGFANAAALRATFVINGNNLQVVQPLDVP
ncbi:hypothetical protein AB0F43_06215 [Kribbella sp. NPDC023972]|uniref:hypothetical protein n=1 Tax=Kribbella sp. NPDC023972 TaxID=3154795 RepID=UPI0034034D03